MFARQDLLERLGLHQHPRHAVAQRRHAVVVETGGGRPDENRMAVDQRTQPGIVRARSTLQADTTRSRLSRPNRTRNSPDEVVGIS